MPAPLLHFIFSSICALTLLVLPGLALLRLCVAARRLTLLSRLTAAPGITVALSVLLFTAFQILHLPLGPLVPWSMILIAIAILVSQFRRRRHLVGKDEWWPGLTLFALLAFLLLVRLNSTRDWIVPPGIDSAPHTVVVQLLLDHHGLFDSWAPYDNAESFTYHFGFHAVAALFAWMTGAQASLAVFVMARVIGLCAVASLFPLVRLWTRSAWGGVFAVAIWELYSRHLYFFDIPGRWPLLTGLTILPCALVLVDLFLRERGRRAWRLALLTALSIAGLLLTQYKTALIFAVLATTFVSARCLRLIFSQPGARARNLMQLLLRAFGVALLAFVLVAPRFHAVLQAKTGQHLQRLVLQAAPPNPEAFGAPILDAGGILRTAFNTPQKVAGSLLALLGGIFILVRRRQAIWFVAGWLLVALVMNPRLIGINRAGVIDEIHWKFAVQTPVAVMAGLAVGLVFDKWGNRRSLIWSIAMMCGALVLATFGAAQTKPIPQSSRYVLTEDLRLILWMKQNLPAGERIASRSFFDHGHVYGIDAAVWLPYFARHQTNQTSFTLLEKAPAGSRERLERFTRELYERDMSTPESARWMREQGFPWFFVGAIQPEVHATLLKQIERNPGLELAWEENAARLYRAR